MPRPTPAGAKERALELGRTMNANQVYERLEAEGLRVAKTTVYDWLKKGSAHRVETEAKDTEAEEPADAELPDGLNTDLEDLDFRALEALVRDIQAYRMKAKRDDAVRTYTALARLEIDARERLYKLRPVKPPDPALDPANITAREILFRNLERMVTEAEKRKI